MIVLPAWMVALPTKYSYCCCSKSPFHDNCDHFQFTRAVLFIVPFWPTTNSAKILSTVKYGTAAGPDVEFYNKTNNYIAYSLPVIVSVRETHTIPPPFLLWTVAASITPFATTTSSQQPWVQHRRLAPRLREYHLKNH